MKKCPYCAQQIQDVALVCRYCGRELPGPSPISQTVPDPPLAFPSEETGNSIARTCGIAALVFAAACLLFWVVGMLMAPDISPVLHSPIPHAKEDAWHACTYFIQKGFGLSTLDAQEYSPANVVELGGERYSVRVYYARENTVYSCTLVQAGAGSWQRLDLERLP